MAKRVPAYAVQAPIQDETDDDVIIIRIHGSMNEIQSDWMDRFTNMYEAKGFVAGKDLVCIAHAGNVIPQAIHIYNADVLLDGDLIQMIVDIRDEALEA